MNFKILIFTLVFITQFFSFGQDTITGKVVDADQGEGLIGAHVYLLNNWRKGAITDVEGKYILELTDHEKNDSLVISFVGFQEVVTPIANDLTIAMESIEKEGETVVVTAKPLIAEEFKYMEIKKIDIYTNPAAKADPLLAVNSLPSSTTSDESANISLRGSSPIETGIFLNNVPLYDGVRYSQLNGIGTFSIFNTSIIKNVTVFPGNPPLEFGNATSGIISMETDDRIVEDNSNSLILSLANVGFSREQVINKNQSIKLFSNWQPSGPIKRLNEKALADIESFTSNDFGAYWYGSNEKIEWKILNYSITEGYEFNFKHPTFEGIFDQSKNRSFVISGLTTPIGTGSLSFNNGLSISRGNYSYSNVTFEVDKKDLFAGINYLLTNDLFSIKAGVSYDYRNSTVDGNFHEFHYALGPNHPTITLNESADVKVLEGFGYFKYFFSEKIAFGSGLRKNVPINNDKSYLSSQANLSYADQYWTITVGAGVYNKFGLFENTGEPFQAENFQKSIDIKRKKSGLEISLSLFDKDGKINESKYSARGIEVFTDYRFSSKFRVSGSITLLDASNDVGNYIYDLSYFIRGNASYNPGRMWTIESTLVARQGSSYSPLSTTQYDDNVDAYIPIYSETDLRFSDYSNLGIAVSKIYPVSTELNLIVFASVNNLLDRQNIRDFTYNFDYSEKENSFFSRRTGYIGVIINF